VSADLAEVLALADRVAVMYGGRFVAVLPRSEATPDNLGWLHDRRDGGARGMNRNSRHRRGDPSAVRRVCCSRPSWAICSFSRSDSRQARSTSCCSMVRGGNAYGFGQGALQATTLHLHPASPSDFGFARRPVQHRRRESARGGRILRGPCGFCSCPAGIPALLCPSRFYILAAGFGGGVWARCPACSRRSSARTK
jgi:hypothetical protein